MPINEMIALQGQVGNPLNALAQGYKLGEFISDRPVRADLNTIKVDQGRANVDQTKAQTDFIKTQREKLARDSNFRAAAMGAQELASTPFEQWGSVLQRRMAEGQQYGYSADAEREALDMLQTNPEGLKQQVTGLARFGQQLFGKSQASRSVALNPGGQLYSQDGTLLAQNSNVRPGAQQSDYFTTESTPQGLVQVNTRVPNDVRPLTGPDGKPLFRSQYDVDLQSRINEGKSQGTATGKTAAARESQFEDWTAFQQSFAEAYPDIGTLMQAAPESSMSQFIINYGVKLIGSTSPYEAQAQIEQLGAILLQQVPFPPGPQSEAEMLQRNKTLGKLEDPNISPNTKLDMIGRFLRMNEAKFRALRNNKAASESPNGPVPPVPGMPATKANMQPVQGIAQPQSQADYDALPSGAVFIDPDDGKQYRKP